MRTGRHMREVNGERRRRNGGRANYVFHSPFLSLRHRKREKDEGGGGGERKMKKEGFIGGEGREYHGQQENQGE